MKKIVHWLVAISTLFVHDIENGEPQLRTFGSETSETLRDNIIMKMVSPEGFEPSTLGFLRNLVKSLIMS